MKTQHKWEEIKKVSRSFYQSIKQIDRDAIRKRIQQKTLKWRKDIILNKFNLRQRRKLKYRLWQGRINTFTESTYFYLFLFIVGIALIYFVLHYYCSKGYNNISDGTIKDIAIAIGSVIGGAMAIIFSFSTFILQNTANLFSTQYLNKFTNSKIEKIAYVILILLAIVCFFIIPIDKNVISNFHKAFILISSLYALFILLVFIVYGHLRKVINPEFTLKKLKDDSIKKIISANKEIVSIAKVNYELLDEKDKDINLVTAATYKLYPQWHSGVLWNIKHLYEIGLRLSSKNELIANNNTLVFIYQIYIQHLIVRNGCFIRMPEGFFGTYSFEDEGFSAQVLEYLKSIGHRFIEENREKNIEFLLSSIYVGLINNSLSIKYADKELGQIKSNPLTSLVLGYYKTFVSLIISSQKTDLVWSAMQSTFNISQQILNKANDYLFVSQLNEILGSLSIFYSQTKQEAFLKEIVKHRFSWIAICWNKYAYDRLLWKDLYESLQNDIILLMLIQSQNSLSLSELFINFSEWQANVFNSIKDIDEENKKEILPKAEILLKNRSDFLLNISMKLGLGNNPIGISIIQSVEHNLQILHYLKNTLEYNYNIRLYSIQLNILSWYFEHMEETDNYCPIEFESIQEILLYELIRNHNQGKDIDDIVSRYISLVEQFFEKIKNGYGYNKPRIIVKLIPLALILHKYGYENEVDTVISKITELNDKYLKINKNYFEKKKEVTNLMGPHTLQTLVEVDDLKEDIFSLNRGIRMDVTKILADEIDEDIRNSFYNKLINNHQSNNEIDSIDELKISKRVKSTLKNNGISDIQTLSKLNKKQLLKIDGIGKKSIEEIISSLADQKNDGKKKSK